MSDDIVELAVTFFDQVNDAVFLRELRCDGLDYLTRRRVEAVVRDAAAECAMPLVRLFLDMKLDNESVRQTLNQLRRGLSGGMLSLEIVSQKGRNADALADELMVKAPCPRVLIRLELEDVYPRAMKAICGLLCSLGPLVADWRTKRFPREYPLIAELLDRLRAVSSRIAELAEEGTDSEDERFERAYLEHLLLRFSAIPYGTVRMTTNIGADLRTLFVHPRARLRPARKRQDDGGDQPMPALMELADARRTLKEATSDEKPRVKEPEEQPALDIIREHRRCVVVGLPGSGKSTFVSWLQLALADGSEALGDGEAPIPVLLRMRELAPRGDMPSPEASIEAATGNRELARQRPQWLRARLAEGRVLLILDGLDETTPRDRDRRVLPWLAGLVAQYPDARYVVTSRPVGYPGGLLRDLEFAECDLQDFGDEQIGDYTRQWCTTVRMAEGEARAQAEEDGKAQGAELLGRVQRNPHVRSLAHNPLMLSAICLVQYFRAGELPDQRAVLYQWCVEGLLHEWDLRRGIQSEFDLDEKLRVTREVAIAMQNDGLAEYAADRVQAIFRGVLNDARRGDALLEHIRYRAGLLVERRPGVYGFAHLTFQEYLAALAVDQGNLLGVEPSHLPPQYADPRWSEVIALYCGLASDTGARSMIAALQEQEPSDALAWVLVNSVLAAGRKLTAQEREGAVRFIARCPARGGESALSLLPDEEAGPVANEEVGRGAGPGSSNAYGLLAGHAHLLDEEVLWRRLGDLPVLDALGAGDLIYLVAVCASESLVRGLFARRDWLNRPGPAFPSGISYPLLAAVALQALSERACAFRDGGADWWFDSVGVCVEAITRLRLARADASFVIALVLGHVSVSPERTEVGRRWLARGLLPIVRQLRSWFDGLPEPRGKAEVEASEAQLVQLDRLIHRLRKLA